MKGLWRVGLVGIVLSSRLHVVLLVSLKHIVWIG